MTKQVIALGSVVMALLLGGLTGCEKSQKTAENAQKNKQFGVAAEETVFDGCYTIDKDTPATIKISQQNGGYVMQMKEPKGSQAIWDNPEKLEVLPLAQGWQYFSTNSIDLSSADVAGDVIARADKMLILLQTHQASANTNPMLDSRYVVSLMGAVNTIYQVPCDDTPVDLINNFHKNSQKG
ncbi:hypothetical protein SAMN02745664_11442 [Moraxella cuniculi DSM 21768]|uniref:Lipoprotein n=1 Tax=Moraxella cuniculi DSM 21768 TaxID=1122245 RepID=A0A1N7FM04_9GAMM|nr:hypothetical protein [Moraxella cuniculi]SIS01428.1 hypothetical protein SAMN02745664_11442 [Moraxella cuniculi DSM 21768]